MIVDSSGLIGAWKLGKLGRIPDPRTTTLLLYEIGNVFWKMQKREPKEWTEVELSVLLDVVEKAFDIIEPNFLEVFSLSREENLSFYDASYLWLAKKFKEPILTLDEDFSGKWEVVRPDEL